MAKANKIIFSIKNQMTAAGYTDDSRLDPELILHIVNDVRSVMMKEYYEKNKTLTPSFYQKSCCLDVICKEISCNNLPTGSKELVVEIPPLADFADISTILFFGLADESIEFRYIPYQNLLYSSYDKYVGKMTTFTYIGTTVTIKDPPTMGLKYVCMVAAWDTPIASCSGEVGEWDYPLPDFLVHKLELLVINQLQSVWVKREDVQNDARDSQIPPQRASSQNTAT